MHGSSCTGFHPDLRPAVCRRRKPSPDWLFARHRDSDERDPDREDGAAPCGTATSSDSSSVGGHDRGGDRQPEPGTATRTRPGGVGAVEAFEDLLRLFLGKPGSVVGDLDYGVIALGTHGHRGRGARRGVRADVREEVVDHLPYPRTVTVDLDGGSGDE